MTDNSADREGLWEERTIEQFPTIGPSLVARWFTVGSLTLEIGRESGQRWAVSVDQLSSEDTSSPTVIRLEARRP